MLWYVINSRSNFSIISLCILLSYQHLRVNVFVLGRDLFKFGSSYKTCIKCSKEGKRGMTQPYQDARKKTTDTLTQSLQYQAISPSHPLQTCCVSLIRHPALFQIFPAQKVCLLWGQKHKFRQERLTKRHGILLAIVKTSWHILVSFMF